MIPGWGVDAKVFEFSDLAYSVLNYSKETDLSLGAIASSLASHIANPSVIVGWSLGGLIAIKLASLFPDKVKKLILISSQPKFLADYSWQGINPEIAAQFIESIQCDFFKFSEGFISLVNYPNRNLLYKRQLKASFLWDEKAKLLLLLQLILSTDLREEYQALKCDILHIIGDKDAVLSQNSFHLYQLNSRVRIVEVKNSGHAGLLTDMAIYQAAIKDFIANE